ncbi:MAG: DNA mismatch repair protein MutS [Acidobacteria bacterium]|nr:DNA mismatch repair protein MutS [Acidobacteriota bacterium]
MTTPMMRQYHALKQKHPNDILFFRMGDFYEMMFEDAVVASAALDITLTKRGKGTKSEAPMCGVPFHAADSYIAKLVRSGHRVAICEQVEDAKGAKGLVKRDVVRVVTPSTMLDDPQVDQRDFQYLAVIVEQAESLGLAFLEFTSGRFDVCQFEGEHRYSEAGDLMVARDPVEILCAARPNWMDPGFLKGRCLTEYDSWHFQQDTAEEEVKSHFDVIKLDGFGIQNAPLAISAAGAALAYVRETQRCVASHIDSIHLLHFSDYLVLDHATLRNLEVTRSIFDGNRRESLLGQIDRTRTAMGARLLREWVLQPLLDLDRIRDRQQHIHRHVHALVARNEIRDLLGGMPDLDRLLSKLALGTISPREMGSLCDCLNAAQELSDWLNELGFDYSLAIHAKTLAEVQVSIAQTLSDDLPAHTRQGGYIAQGVHDELDELKDLRKNSKGALARIEARERESTQIPKLKIQYNKVFGYYIEISKIHSERVPDSYQRKQTLVNSERYITDELKVLEEKILGAEDRMVTLEQEIYAGLVQSCTDQLTTLRQYARLLAELDVHAALADLAVDYNYCLPEVREDGNIVIVEGRHPVVEALSHEPFIPNDTLLDMDDDRVHIITGPNMGGKSTYLRQVALITLMAQMGSYVPAKKAEIGIVDRIFTRVGASDHLARGQSTFMVEMIETAHILHHATHRSLIVLDEIGRGTSTFDGLSLAWATAEYISDRDRVGAKTLFATHYHEMTELERTTPGVRNMHITVREWQGNIVFLRRIERGTADQSYGIHVAKLAGLPREVVRRAREVLANLERNELDTSGKPKLAKGQGLSAAKDEPQMSLFPAERSELEDALLALDLDDLTPREALDLLYRWREEL